MNDARPANVVVIDEEAALGASIQGRLRSVGLRSEPFGRVQLLTTVCRLVVPRL
jgi:hypothetical protein